MNSFRKYLKVIDKNQMAVSLVILLSVVFAVFDIAEFSQLYEYKLLDMRFLLRETRESSVNDKIVIVAIDDQSMNELRVRWPWPRTMYAKVIDQLSNAGAKVVAFDLVFSEPSEKERVADDRLFARAIESSKAWIVLGSKFFTMKTPQGTQTGYVAPYGTIDEYKTHVGFVNIWPDQDGIIRHSALLRKHLKTLYESFAVKIMRRYYNVQNPLVAVSTDMVELGDFKIATERKANLLINFRGGPGKFQTISFENVYHEEIMKELTESGIFKDKIVLVGPTFTEAQDNHPTPYFRNLTKEMTDVTPGVEIHANILDTIMMGQYYQGINGWWRVLIYFIFPLLMVLGTVRLKPLQGAVVLIITILIYSGLTLWVFNAFRLILPLFNPMLCFFINYIGIVVILLTTEEKKSRFIKGVFSRYVSPKVVDELVRNPNVELKLGGKKQVVTVLFSDIRSFTTLSEQLSPEEVVEQLNEYFEKWTEVIFKYDGMVDKFIGDAVMAVFGAPVARPDDPVRAVQAAWEMKSTLQQLQTKWQTEGKRIFNIGVGLNTGEAIVGNMGSRQAMGYTVIGDTVNLASRLESKTKDLAAYLLISESTYEYVKGMIEAQEFKDITVKGKAKSFSVYSVLGWKPKGSMVDKQN